MLIPQLIAILSCSVIIGTSLHRFPTAFNAVIDAQRLMERGEYGARSSSSSPNAFLFDGVVDGASPNIAVGDAVSLTSRGRMTFGFHALLMRYPVDTYLEGAELVDIGTTATVTTIRSSVIRSAAGASASALLADEPAPTVAAASLAAGLHPSRSTFSALATAPILGTTPRVNSTRGVVSIDQCYVLLERSSTAGGGGGGGDVNLLLSSDADDAEEERAFGALDIDGGAGPSTSPQSPTGGEMVGADALDPSSGLKPVGVSLASRATSTSLVLLHDRTKAVAPRNVFPYYTSEEASDVYSPGLQMDAADASFNGGVRGFPTESSAFFMLKFMQSTRQLSSARMPVPLVIDEDPSDTTNAFPFGLHGARSDSQGSPAHAINLARNTKSASVAAQGRSAVFLVPIPAQHRLREFPTSDSECVRFGQNNSLSVTNVGLAATSIGGSVPIMYHRGCFVAVVANLKEVSLIANSIASIMPTIVSEWISRNARAGNTYTDTIYAPRRSSTGDIVARDGSRFTFVSVRVGPAVTSAVYRNLVEPMRDTQAGGYFPPMFISWVGGVHKFGTCSVPQFFDDGLNRRISVKV